MSAEMNVYEAGTTTCIDMERITNSYTHHLFRRNNSNSSFQLGTTSKNMNNLLNHFHSTENYPEYYLGLAKKMAKCKCPTTGEEELFNGTRCLSVENPSKGSVVNVTFTIKDKTYIKKVIFVGWINQPTHEWRMNKGTILRLEQSFVDGLSPEDKRYLKMYH